MAKFLDGADIQNMTLGGKEVRKSRWWDRSGGGGVAFKPSRQITVDENNVALPSNASIAALAAGAVGVLTMGAQRNCIVRDLVMDAYDAGAPALLLASPREGNVAITGITVAGENCFAGNGELPIRTFFADSFDRPSFDMPVAGGTNVVVNVINRSLSVAGTDIMAGCIID